MLPKRNPVAVVLGLARERGTRGALGSMGLTVAKNVLRLGAGILLARILEPSGYGKYAFAMSLVNIVGLFVLLGLPGLTHDFRLRP